jgi:plastocyanin
MTTRALLLLTLAILTFGLVACGDDENDDATSGANTSAAETTATTPPPDADNAPAPSGDAVRAAKVEIVDFAYDPDPVEVEEGGKVIWINRDAEPHTATADDDSFDTGTLEEGKLKSETFKEPGTYAYICSIHPEMKGTVEVVESG